MSTVAMTSGFHLDMPFPEYLQHPGYGSSDVKTYRTATAADVKFRRENRGEGTAATRLGTAAHCKVITPELFDGEYAIKEQGMTFVSKAGKAQRDAWLSQGLGILSYTEHEQVLGVQAAVSGKLAAADSLTRSVGRETSLFWQCAESGLQCKGRPDWYTDDTVYDLKVSIEATKGRSRMTYALHANGWLHQLAHNRAGLNANGMNVKNGALVVVSPIAPHNVWLLRLKEADCDFLELQNENARKGLAECERTGAWPGTPDDWETIELPMSATWTELDTTGAEETI